MRTLLLVASRSMKWARLRTLRELASEAKKEVKTCTNSFPRNDENQVQVVHPLLALAVPRVGYGLSAQLGPGITGHSWPSRGLVELTCPWKALGGTVPLKGSGLPLSFAKEPWSAFPLSRLEAAQDNFEVG